MIYYILGVTLTVAIVIIIFTIIKKMVSWDNFYGGLLGLSFVFWGLGECLQKGFYLNIEKITLFWGIFVMMFGFACIDESLGRLRFQERIAKNLKKILKRKS